MLPILITKRWAQSHPGVQAVSLQVDYKSSTQ